MPTGRIPGPIGYGPQQPTLRTAGPLSFEPQPLELTRWATMLGDFWRKMDNLSDDERRQWYLETLGKYYDQMKESARSNRIPVELLAAILLNEIADINVNNWAQHRLAPYLETGSFGIGQIQVSTALKDHLFKGILDDPSSPTAARDIARLMTVPQYSIETTAREIRHILDLMERAPEQKWPSQFSFVPPSPHDWDPDRYYAPGTIRTNKANSGNSDAEQEDRQAHLARMVASAYNGGDKFIKEPLGAGNSFIHGINAEFIARDLFRMRLFRSPSSGRGRPSDPQPASKHKVHKVIAGDTLSKLAENYYGDARLWSILFGANRESIDNPNMLIVGRYLNIPNLSELSPSVVERARATPPPQAGANTILMPPLR